MCVFKNGKLYHYEFILDGRRRRGSTGTADRDEAVREESRQRERLEKSYSQVIEEEAREQRRKTIQQASDEFLLEYKVKHESPTFAVYALGHVADHLGKKLVVEITPAVVKAYQTSRLAEKAGPKTINNEVLLLLRLCGDQGDLIRARLRREKAMKLATPPSPGRAYSADEKARMLAEAAKLRSKNMYPALVVDLNCGLRDKELRELRWRQIDLVHKKALTVGKSKTAAGTGRMIPLNDAAERSHPPGDNVKDGVDEGARQSQSRWAVARQPAHAGHRARRVGRGRRSDHEHRRARLSRHALALLPRADGSEAAGPRRDRHAATRRRREAQGRSRAAEAGRIGFSASHHSIIGGRSYSSRSSRRPTKFRPYPGRSV
ncbi:MAG: hypothetical protein ABSF25_27285 [Bryobacteraceae bacterium]